MVTKKTLAKEISGILKVPEKDIKEIIDILFMLLRAHLISQEKVSISEFCIFEVYQVQEHKRINPVTKEPMICGAYNKVGFRALKKLREGLRSKK